MRSVLEKAIQLLLTNRTEHGFLASTPTPKATKKWYDRIFGRDGAICAIAAFTTTNEELHTYAMNTLDTLSKFQTELGQIPNSISPNHPSNKVEFWYLGCIDATLWWALAILWGDQLQPHLRIADKEHDNLVRALTWLRCQDQNNCGLLEQLEASDWADVMPRAGNVLCTNALYIGILSKYAEYLEHSGLERQGISSVYKRAFEAFDLLFWIDIDEEDEVHEEEFNPKWHFLRRWIGAQVHWLPYYAEYVGYYTLGHRCDVLANSLAILLDVALPKRQHQIIEYMLKASINRPFPCRALYPPILPGDDDYRPYLNRRAQNFPWQYHNGGIWPFIGGFWIAALEKCKYSTDEDVRLLEEAVTLNEYEFNEYLHGLTGVPMGMPHQSWSAAGILIAEAARKNQL